MAIQHKDIPEAELHEPKGASLAPQDTVYVANGSGSGVWKKVGTASMTGLGALSGASGKVLLTDGLGGLSSSQAAAYGSLAISNNSTNFAMTAATDGTLNTNTDYKVISGTGAPWTPDLTYEVGTVADGITVLHDGVYKVETWLDIVSFPDNTARLALKYVVNGNQYSLRKVSVKSNSGGDEGSLNGFGLITLNAGDTVRLAVASSHSGNMILESGNLTITLIRAL